MSIQDSVYSMHTQTADCIPQAFADCIGGLLSVAAQNISLTIKGAPGVQVEAVLSKRMPSLHSYVIAFSS